MADLIDRQKAIDEILRLTSYDTVRSLYEATVANKYEDCFEDGIIDAIDAVIGVDVAEIVRCADCEYYTAAEKWCRRLGLCGAFNDDGFCSYGTRRDEEE